MFDRIRVSSLALALGAVLLASTAAPRLRASELDKKTIVTFNGPVELGGRVLPAGMYVFKTPEDNRDVVIVMNEDENSVIATVLAVPVQAATVPDQARIELSESVRNAPQAIHAWFYPGDSTGWEFPGPAGK